MDVLFLEGLDVPCRVGCTPEERAAPQSLSVEATLHCPTLGRAALNDDLKDTVDYRVATKMIAAVQGTEFLLIERVAEVLASVALAEEQVVRVDITIRKRPPVQGIQTVGVRITRSRPSGT